MMVLIVPFFSCLRSLLPALCIEERPATPIQRALEAIQFVASQHRHLLAPIHAPTPRLLRQIT